MKVILTFIILLFLVISSSASDLNSTGKPGTFEQFTPATKTLKFLNSQGKEAGPFHVSKTNAIINVSEDEIGYSTSPEKTNYLPFYQSLEKLAASEKENSQIEIETNSDISLNLSRKVNQIKSLWNSGYHKNAIEKLKVLTSENEKLVTGLGIGWKTPRVLYNTEGVDVQIGARSGVYWSELDFDETTGNLFALVLFDDGSNKGWTVNFSSDGGATWTETYYWNSGTYTLNDVDASKVGNYFWVGYVVNSATQDAARMRRFNVSDGSVDIVYGWETVFDFNVTIREVSVFSNADNFNNRIYYYAITADDSIRCFWDDMTGTGWTDYSPGISNLSHGLDVCWNYNATNDYIFVSYVNTQGMLHVLQGTSGGWTDVELSSASANSDHVTSIGAYQDTVIIVYETGTNIEYRISYNEGTSWAIGTVAAGSNFHNPHVAGRKNGGFAVVYAEEAGAFDPVWFVRRDYSVPGWSTPLQVNEIDAMSNYWNNIEYIPPVSEPYAHGAIFPFFDGSGGNAYFDRVENLQPSDIFVNPVSIAMSLQEGAIDSAVLTIYNMAAAGANSLIWDITEQVGCAWLSQNPVRGSVVPGSFQTVLIYFDATSLSHGVYACTLLVNSNDPNEPQVAIPVELTVEQMPPDISVSPLSFNFTVPEDGTDTDNLTIYNNAAAGSADLNWDIIDRELSLVTKSGKKIPIRVGTKTEYIKGTNAPSSGIAPTEMSKIIQQNTGKTNFNELLTPLDFGYGPENYNSAIGNFVLNNPEYINLGGTYPSTLYAGAEFANNGNYSMMYCFDYNSNLFVSIDIGSGIVDTIGSATPYSGESWVGLATDPTSGTMYAASTSITNSSIYTIDLATANTTRIGEITNVQAIIAIAIDNLGQMYGYDLVTDSLVAVDKNTAVGTQIGPLGFDANYAQGMDFDESDGTLYLAAYNNAAGPELRIADPVTGMTTLLGPLGSAYPVGNVHITGFGIGNQSDCPWISELPSSGTISPGNSQNVDITVDASGLPIDVYQCELRVLHNDPNEPAIIIPVELNVVGAPSIVVDPVVVTETVDHGDSLLSPIQIENAGSTELHWHARLTNFKNLVSNPQFTHEQLNQAMATHNNAGVVENIKKSNQPSNGELIKGKIKQLSTEQFVLWDNGPLVNSPGSGIGGADESVVQSLSLGMTTLGFGHQVLNNNRIADDFVVTGSNWTVDHIILFAYQTGSDTNSTITEVNYRIWDGPPGEPGSNVVFGDTATNKLITTSWSGIYRVTETSFGTTNRPVMENIVSGGFSLLPGRYWIDWQSGGSLGSGPWAPPITVTGMDSTGDALQYTGLWGPVIDSGSSARQGFPFIIEGTADEVWMKMAGPVSGTLTPGSTFDLDLRLYGVIPDSIFTGEITITSNDVSQPAISVPVELTVIPPNSIDPSDVGLITKYELLQNYPNPFNPSTTIKYRLANQKSQQTTLKIYNSLGQLIRTLVNTEQGNGEYTIVWDGLDDYRKEVASGLYFYKLQSGNFVKTQKLLKLK